MNVCFNIGYGDFENYKIFDVEGDGESMAWCCSNEKEAAKLFGLYLDHKVSLPKLFIIFIHSIS